MNGSRSIYVAVAALAMVGCAANGDRTGTAVIATPASATSPATPPAGVTSPASATSVPTGTAVSASTSQAPTVSSLAPVDVTTISATTTLLNTFEAPTGLAVRPHDDRFYIVQQAGQIVRFDGSSIATMLDIAELVSYSGERGLLGLAFHPVEPLAYVDYTDVDGNTVVAEYAVNEEGFTPTSARTVLRVEQPYVNHNGGDLAFGPDAMLYVALGDGGSGGDPGRRASDPTVLLGSILRIDPTGRAHGAYSIPADNPFGNEVWSFGLRNPWRFNFDPVTGDLWIADVGQNAYEEVNRVSPVNGGTAGRGTNFGWSAYEAMTPYNDDVAVDESRPAVFPVLYYPHGVDGCSISGGASYANVYIYGDFCSGKVWAFDATAGAQREILDGLSEISAIRSGPDGNPYVLELSGAVRRIEFANI